MDYDGDFLMKIRTFCRLNVYKSNKEEQSWIVHLTGRRGGQTGLRLAGLNGR